MSPFDKHGKRHVAACFATAAAYAFCTGNQPAPYRLADAGVYGLLLCVTGMIFWNAARFATPGRQEPASRALLLLALAVLSVALTVGMETLAMYLLAPSSFPRFAATLPARVFITLLLFAITRLYYLPRAARGEALAGQGEAPPLPARPLDRVTIRDGQKIKIIAVDEITYIKADGDYISIHAPGGSWLKEQTMKQAEATLPPGKFIRVHRSFIVNVNHVSRVERHGERWQLVLHDREKIKISAARYRALRQILGF